MRVRIQLGGCDASVDRIELGTQSRRSGQICSLRRPRGRGESAHDVHPQFGAEDQIGAPGQRRFAEQPRSRPTLVLPVRFRRLSQGLPVALRNRRTRIRLGATLPSNGAKSQSNTEPVHSTPSQIQVNWLRVLVVHLGPISRKPTAEKPGDTVIPSRLSAAAIVSPLPAGNPAPEASSLPRRQPVVTTRKLPQPPTAYR